MLGTVVSQAYFKLFGLIFDTAVSKTARTVFFFACVSWRPLAATVGSAWVTQLSRRWWERTAAPFLGFLFFYLVAQLRASWSTYPRYGCTCTPHRQRDWPRYWNMTYSSSCCGILSYRVTSHVVISLSSFSFLVLFFLSCSSFTSVSRVYSMSRIIWKLGTRSASNWITSIQTGTGRLDYCTAFFAPCFFFFFFEFYLFIY